MLSDPVDGFLSGLGSGLWRTAVASLPIMAGAAVCRLSSSLDLAWGDPFLWAPLFLGMLFWWTVYDWWFFVGLCAFVAIFTSLWAWTQEHAPRLSFFAIFAAATVYFSPLCFHQRRWVSAAGVFGVCTLLYWLGPATLRRILRRSS